MTFSTPSCSWGSIIARSIARSLAEVIFASIYRKQSGKFSANYNFWALPDNCQAKAKFVRTSAKIDLTYSMPFNNLGSLLVFTKLLQAKPQQVASNDIHSE